MLGRNLDEEQSQIETDPVSSLIRAAIIVRHDVQRNMFFCFRHSRPGGLAWREAEIVTEVIVNSPSRILQWQLSQMHVTVDDDVLGGK